jgi:ketosteroid isomerase-like protein
MRNRVLAVSCLFSLVVVAACSSETVAPPPKPPVGSLTPVAVSGPKVDVVTAKERALPEIYVKALSSSAADGGAQFGDIAPLMNSDLSGFFSPGATPEHDPTAIAAAHNKLFGAFDDRKMTLTRIWRTPNEQTVEWTMTATHAREWKGVAPTHKPVTIKGVTLLWTKDDGSITDIHVYFDVAVVKAELGVGPKDVEPPAASAPPAGGPQDLLQASPPSADETKDVDVVKSAFDSLENLSEAGYVGAMADDVEVYSLEHAAPVMHGKADAKAYYKAMHKAIGQLDTTIMGEWGVGKFAIVEYSIAGEQIGPIQWIPAQRDKVVRFELVDICELRDGKIARVWRYDNPGQVLDQ